MNIQRDQPSLSISSLKGWGGEQRLVNGGEQEAYKCAGAPGSILCSQSPSIEQQGDCHPPSYGQLHSSSLCESYGGNKVPSALWNPLPHSFTYSWGQEYHGRSSLKVQTRLETQPYYIPEVRQSMGSRSVCHQNLDSVGQIVQLAARSICRGSRCFHTGLVPLQGICQPSSRTVHSASDTTESNSSPSNSSMAIPTMVPSAISPDTRSSPSTPPEGRSDISISGRDRVSERMAHLRKSYRDAGFSERSAKLFLASSINKNYMEPLGEMVLVNPISPPVSAILDFFGNHV